MHDLVCPDRHLDEALAALDRFERAPIRGLAMPELKLLLGKLGRLNSRNDAAMCRVTAEVDASCSAVGAAGVLQRSTRMSKRDADRMARTAKGLAEMPNVAERLGQGDISLGHASALTDTARQVGADAVDSNTELLNRASVAPPDLFAHDVRRFADEASKDRGESEHRRQRRRRSLSLFKDSDSGMGRLSGWLDQVSFGLVSQAIDSHADTLRRLDTAVADGGEPQRTSTQRRADALVELTTDRDALSLQLLDNGEGTGVGVSGMTGKAVRGKKGGTRRDQSSTHLIVVADIGLIDGTDPAGRCEIPGTGPVPPSILGKLSLDAELAGMIFGDDGAPLRLGRSRRVASLPQRIAVAVRDRGCVECGAPMHQCQIHHVRPWEEDGPTNIENLQALCRAHHRQHHGHFDRQKQRSDRDKKRKPDRSREHPPPGHAADLSSGDPLNGRLLL